MPSLKELSIALGLLTSDNAPIAEADGWQNYVWRVRPVQQCLSVDQGFCALVEDNWDWKRPQFYRYAFRLDSAKNRVISRLTLRNEDPADDDHVCIVASFLDREGQEVGIFFANWRALPERTYTREAPIIPSKPVAEIATVVVGSKQCDVKAVPDSRNFSRVRSKLGQR